MTQLASNPYAPPKHAKEGRHPGVLQNLEVWRDGNRVVCERNSYLPDRCVRCNQPALGYQLRRKMSWHHPLLFLLILAGLLVYIIVALVVRKTATVYVGLCPQHRARRRLGLWIGYGGFMAAVTGFILAANAAEGYEALLVAPSCLLLVICPIVGAIMAQVTKPTKIDNEFVWLKTGKLFVRSLSPRL